MTRLRNNLCFMLPDSEVSDILNDMSDFFDAGIAEGKNEDDICRELGDPQNTAKEIVAERGEKPDPFYSQIGRKYISPLICAVLGIAVFFASDFMTAAALVIVGLLLPPLIHLILEKNNFTNSLKAEKTDVFALCAAMLWFGAVLVFRPFSNVVMFSDVSDIFALSVKLAALLIAPQIMLLCSVYKSGMSKVFIIVPAFIIGMTFISEFIISQSIVDELYAERYTARVYFAYFGTMLNVCSIILIITAVELFLWEILNRNAFSVPTLYAAVFGGIIAKFMRWELLRIDPTDFNSRYFVNDGAFYLLAVVGTAAVLISLAVIIRIRQTPKAQPPKPNMEISSAVQ